MVQTYADGLRTLTIAMKTQVWRQFCVRLECLDMTPDHVTSMQAAIGDTAALLHAQHLLL